MRRNLERTNDGDYLAADDWTEMQVFQAEQDADAGDELDPALDEFGLNLEPFEMGVGFVFALFNLIMSAIALSESTDPLDEAQNSLFLASSILEGVAFGVGIATTFVEVAAETAALVASIVSACTIFASILAAIGLAITLAVMSMPHDTPIQTFAKSDANDEGFAMLLGYAIESFEAYAPKQGPSLAGVTVAGAGSGSNVLRVGTDGALSYAPPDQTGATCWYLTVDGTGQARLSSADAASGKVVCLAVDKSGQLVTAPIDTSSTGTPQLWIATLQQAPATSGDSDPVAGVFQLTPVADPTFYLDLSGPQPRVGTTATSVVLSMATMKPQGLTMSDMVLSTADRDRVFAPQLVVPGSVPATWALSPAPPPWLTFNPATGLLTQELGVAAPVTPTTTFTLTCDNQVGRSQTTFTLQVKAPATVEV